MLVVTGQKWSKLVIVGQNWSEDVVVVIAGQNWSKLVMSLQKKQWWSEVVKTGHVWSCSCVKMITTTRHVLLYIMDAVL